MSATICWRLQSDEGKCFHGGTSSSFDNLIRAIGSELKESDVSVLRAMALASGDTFYDEVADIIEGVGAIRIWATY